MRYEYTFTEVAEIVAQHTIKTHGLNKAAGSPLFHVENIVLNQVAALPSDLGGREVRHTIDLDKVTLSFGLRLGSE